MDTVARDNGNLRITETIRLGDSRDPKESIANIGFSFKTPVKDNPSVTEQLVDNV
ncbi:inositol monophosphatase [Aeromonas phage AhSzq-1]|uniref:Inositol monophosphatase n=1 Tax=Aeromonas phage AhSzq-1 TaxID=2138298 RepID=A0A2R4ALY7_9CAUD|nr:inositol monophosphatase [Aeromonas phage AhSzq-1]AVR76016.1 inositol monophosphatase [Aeromonas phage AhSzq-1]